MPLTFAHPAMFHWIVRMPMVFHLPKPFDRKFSRVAIEPWVNQGANLQLIGTAIVLLIIALMNILSMKTP